MLRILAVLNHLPLDFYLEYNLLLIDFRHNTKLPGV